MRSRRLVIGCLLLAGATLAGPALAQGFGQNKPSYDRFDWKVYRSPHFDIYYYPEEENLLEDIVSEAESAYLDISQRLDHEVSIRIPLLMYRTHAEFRQTNVSLQQIPQAAGAFAEPFQKRMVLPVDDPPDKRYKLIRHELVHIFQFDILYGESLRRIIRSQPPLWLTEGMASFLADDEDSFDQMVIRDAVVNNLVPSIEELDVLSFLTYRFGNAIFSFIEEEWGAEGIRTFLFEYRKALVARSVSKPFSDAFGLSTEQFDRRFARYLRKRYLPVLIGKRSPDEFGKEIGLSKRGRFTFSPELSPSRDLIAVLGTPRLELDVLILSAKDGEVIRNITKGFTNKYESVATGVFSGQRDLAWSPGGDQLAFFVERETVRDLLIYDPVSGRKLDKFTFEEISEPGSPSFSPDGRYLAFSGNLDGYWDIFRIELATKKIENVTADPYFDSNPTWSAEGEQLLYNRRIGSFEKIFMVQVGSPERKTQLTAGASSDIQPSFSRDGKWIYFSSDRGEFGIFNLHRLDVATGKIERLTDLVGGAFAPVDLGPADDGTPQLAFSAYFAGTYRLYRMKVGGEEVARAKETGRSEPQTSPLAPSRKRQAPPAEETEPDPRSKDEKEPGPAAAAPGPAAQRAAPILRPGIHLAAAMARDASSEQGEDDDLEPFRPPLQLGIDEDRKDEYKPEWSVDTPGITVGVTDDGRFLSNVSLQFTDVLGDRRIFVQSASIDSFSSNQVAYLNVSRRLDWGARFRDNRGFFLVQDENGVLREGQDRFTTVDAFAQYPFNRSYRLEGSAGYAQQRNEQPIVNSLGQLAGFVEFENDFPFVSAALVGDTTRYQSFGPFHGHRFRIDTLAYTVTSGTLKDSSVVQTRLDFRFYQHMTSRSLIAFRAAAVLQNGDTASFYGVGGTNQLRGFEYQQFFGENVAWANLEVRFPLIDAVFWSFGLPMGPVRGFLFADAGTAWLDDFQVFDSSGNLIDTIDKAVFDLQSGGVRPYESRGSNGLFRDVHVSAGFGLQVRFLGLPLNWSWAKRYDGRDFGPSRSDFYIVFDW